MKYSKQWPCVCHTQGLGCYGGCLLCGKDEGYVVDVGRVAIMCFSDSPPPYNDIYVPARIRERHVPLITVKFIVAVSHTTQSCVTLVVVTSVTSVLSQCSYNNAEGRGLHLSVF